MPCIFIDPPSWRLLCELILHQAPILDTRSRGELAIRIYNRGKRGQIVLAVSMKLIQLIQQSVAEGDSKNSNEVTAVVLPFEVLTEGQSFELLPGGRLLWMEGYALKRAALAEAVKWCQQLDVDPAYYEASQRLLM